MILLDTNAIIWLAQQPGLLTQKASDAISKARTEGGVAASDKSLWEIAMVVSSGQVSIEPSLESFLQSVENTLHIFPINAAIAARSVKFTSKFPKDPADRIIAATALAYGIPLLTSDKAIRASGEVPTIW